MDIHWRNTQKSARFFMLDARAAAMLLVFMLHARIWSLVLTVLSMALFWFLERLGLTFASAIRAMRSYVLGQKRPANHRRSIRRWVDFEQ